MVGSEKLRWRGGAAALRAEEKRSRDRESRVDSGGMDDDVYTTDNYDSRARAGRVGSGPTTFGDRN